MIWPQLLVCQEQISASTVDFARQSLKQEEILRDGIHAKQ